MAFGPSVTEGLVISSQNSASKIFIVLSQENLEFLIISTLLASYQSLMINPKIAYPFQLFFFSPNFHSARLELAQKSASQGNVFFPEPYHDPKYLNWIYGTNLNLKEVLRSLASQSANCSPSTRKDSGPNALHFVPLSKDVNCRELSNYGMQNNNETTGGQNSISEPFQTIDGVYTRADRRSRTDRSCGISAGNNSFVNASAYRMEFNGDIGERSTFQSPKATDNCNKSGHKDDDLIEF
ncbi:MAG: hypothetical protein MHMPM18_005065 [Marteilia pararefringens]